jgi:hypothetical protein
VVRFFSGGGGRPALEGWRLPGKRTRRQASPLLGVAEGLADGYVAGIFLYTRVIRNMLH